MDGEGQSSGGDVTKDPEERLLWGVFRADDERGLPGWMVRGIIRGGC